jgi:hypothetical protein
VKRTAASGRLQTDALNAEYGISPILSVENGRK